MRLKIHAAAANDELISLVNQGYEALQTMHNLYLAAKESGTYNDQSDLSEIASPINEWVHRTTEALISIFPTNLEANIFNDPEVTLGAVSGDYNYQSMASRCRFYIRGLNKIRMNYLIDYTDLPLDARLYIEDIDSFAKVRDINPALISSYLKNGYLDMSEDDVQMSFERILSVPFHKKDWGGEQNDLYTSNVSIFGKRRQSAFLLKGNGLRRNTMHIANCGKNGDQIIRLFDTTADVYFIQFIGNVSESVIRDADGKAQIARSKGRNINYCIIDGQDTARLLFAYGELNRV